MKLQNTVNIRGGRGVLVIQAEALERQRETERHCERPNRNQGAAFGDEPRP